MTHAGQLPAPRSAASLIRLLVASLTGGIEALLFLRLLARLLAARPDNASLQLLIAPTDPLVLPLHYVDRYQPRFGAVLELSTLILLLVVPMLGYVLWRVAWHALKLWR